MMKVGLLINSMEPNEQPTQWQSVKGGPKS